MRSPERRQRALVAGVLLAVVLALVAWPDDRPGERADAAVQSCGPNDANRASLTTRGGQQLRPCLSRTNLRISIPRTSYRCGVFNLSTCYEKKWSITGVARSGLQTVRFADGSTEQLYRLTFREFRVDKDITMRTTNGSGYTLSLLPDAAAKLGGAGSSGSVVLTDMWVTADSIINLDFNVLGIGFQCSGNTRVDNGLLGVTDWVQLNVTGCGMELDARYVVTSAETGDIEGQYSVNLPNTTIRVS